MATTKIRSPIWQYFNISSDNNKYAICSLCEVKISRGGEGKKAGTTAMSNHLKTKHPEKFNAIMKDKAEKSRHAITSSVHDTINRQITTPQSVKRESFWNDNDVKVKKFNYLIAELIALDNEPLSVVENIGFTRLLEQALPRYEKPSCTHIAQNIFPDIYKRICEKIKRNITNALVISVTSDIWNCSHNNTSVLRFTGHWLSPEFQMQHGVLAVKPFVRSQIGVDIAKELNTIAACWDIQERKIHMLIHNSDVNIVKDVGVADYDSDNCFIQSLQMVITESLKMQFEVIEVITTCRHLVAHLNYSNLTKKLLAIQKKLQLPEHQLVPDINTRWNSTFYMVERILEQKLAISILVAGHDTLANFTPQQWSLMEQFITLLKPFEEITKIISSGFSCISEVIPHVAVLKKYLDNGETAQKTPDLLHLRISLKAELLNHFTSLRQDANYLIATFLDPRFKTKYLRVHEVERAQEKILLDFIKMSRCEAFDSMSSSVEMKKCDDNTRPIGAYIVPENLWDCPNEVLNKNKRQCTDEENETIASEIDYYLNTIRIDRDSDPYVWWSANLKQYPNLTKFARIYLSAPCSSVNRERLFSEAGLVYEDKLRQLSLNTDKLVFIHYNLPLVNFEY